MLSISLSTSNGRFHWPGVLVFSTTLSYIQMNIAMLLETFKLLHQVVLFSGQLIKVNFRCNTRFKLDTRGC